MKSMLYAICNQESLIYSVCQSSLADLYLYPSVMAMWLRPEDVVTAGQYLNLLNGRIGKDAIVLAAQHNSVGASRT